MAFVRIPIYEGPDAQHASRETRPYLSTKKVFSARDELQLDANPSFFSRHTYVEVVLVGKTEGKFLEDPNVYPDETMERVSKLVYWSHADISEKAGDITNEVKKKIKQGAKVPGLVVDVTGALHCAYSEGVTGAVSAATSLMGRHIYYEHLLSARNARDRLENSSGGALGGATDVVRSYVGNLGRITTATITPS